MFKHFLITRFNVRVPDWERTKSGNSVLGEDWLKERFELFESYCFPSILNQKNKNFIWLIYFDIRTPQFYKLKAKKIFSQFDFIKYYFIDGHDYFLKSIQMAIADLMLKEVSSFIITTRLDNDDMVSSKFIDTIQDNFIPEPDMVFDIVQGYQLSIKNNKSVPRYLDAKFNPFISLIENRNNIKTVFSKMHGEWYNSQKVISYANNRLWVQVVHENNKVNDTNYEDKILFKFKYKDFGLKRLPQAMPTKISILLFNLKKDSVFFLHRISEKIKRIIKH